jgi:hypothetical protein
MGFFLMDAQAAAMRLILKNIASVARAGAMLAFRVSGADLLISESTNFPVALVDRSRFEAYIRRVLDTNLSNWRRGCIVRAVARVSCGV